MPLGSCCNFQEGYVNPSQKNPEYFDGDIKWIRAVDLNDSYVYETSRTLTTEGFNSAGKSALLFKPNTIVISKSGTVGRLGIIKDYMCGNRATINIIPYENVSMKFIFYVLKYHQRHFSDMAVGSVQKNLYVSILENLEIPLPSIDIQNKIAFIFSNIDDKIDCIHKININLTTSLLLLFKNWFVDFNFLNENNKPYKTDNGKMKNSELGLIPNDWDIGFLGDYLRIERGFSYKGKYLSDDGVPLINLGNILPNSKFRLEKLKFYSGDFDEKYVVNVGDILVANTDLTQDRLVLGSPIIVPSLIDNDVIIYSHHINRLSNFKLPKYYIFYNLLSERYNHMVSGHATGTTVLAISKESISNYQITIPPKELLLQFEEIAENIEKIKENNLLEIEKLTKLRDTLLPKLMSGEIDVSKINCDMLPTSRKNWDNEFTSAIQNNLIEVIS